MKRHFSQQTGGAKGGKFRKLLLCMFVVLTCVAMLLIGTVGASAASTGIVAGDANGDGVVDGKDVTRIRKFLADYDPYSGTSTVTVYPGADANEDGIISEADLTIILNSLANYDESQPVEPIVKHSYYIKDECVYYYGEDGFMCTDVTVNGYYFGTDGKLDADKVLIDIDGETYYIEEGKLAHGYRVIDNQIFFFTEDGSMLKDATYEDNLYSSYGYLVADRDFVTVGENTYYLYDSVITYGCEIIENRIYNFGEDGVMAQSESIDGYSYGPEGYMITNDVFVTVDGFTYFVHEGLISFEYQFISGRIYYFGQDGKMISNTLFAGNYHGEDGYIVANESFVLVDGKFYFLIDNVVTLGYKIINNMIYCFDTESGAMFIDETVDGYYFSEYGYLYADKEFVTIGDAVYYLDNSTVTYGYAFIESKIYFFDTDGVMAQNENVGEYFFGTDGNLEADGEFVTIEGNIYYVLGNLITYNYKLIDGKIYYFGQDGRMIMDTHFAGNYHGEEGYIVADESFVLVDGKTYYLVDNVISIGYKILDGKAYYFDTETGAMFTDATVNGYYHCEYGYITVTEKTTITIDGQLYWIATSSLLYTPTYISGVVYGSDSDIDFANNEKLAGVNVTLLVAGEVFITATDENGYFDFPSIPDDEIMILFEKSGYDDVYGSALAETSVRVIMDKSITTSVIGKVTVADGDASILNNASLSGVKVQIDRASSSNYFSYVTYSDANGEFKFDSVTNGVYVITYTFDGYVTAEQVLCVSVDPEIAVTDIGTVELVEITNTETGYVSGVITDAKSKLPAKGLTIIVREGIDNVLTDALMTVKTGADGSYTVGPLPAGNYTLVIIDERELDDEAERYAEIVVNIAVIPGSYVKDRNLTVTNLAGLSADSIKIVLSWGTNPKDLDAHLEFASGENSYHVSYIETSAPGISLDYDDTTSFGPETITVTEVADGVYKYYVHNRSDENNDSSSELASSGASVRIYINGSTAPAYSFYAPDGIGTYWYVFTYDSTTGEFTIVNEIGNALN